MSLADKKGVWIWELSKLPRDYLERLKKQGVGRVFLKTFDGKSQGDGIWRFQASHTVMDSFKRAGIEVWAWGYHYGDTVTKDFEAIKFARATGCAGYVLDVEQEFKARSTHANLESLLERCVIELREPEGMTFHIGFTSFGHCGFHAEIPWTLLYRFCDVSLPQIYYEKFGFGTDAQEIKECMDSNRKLSGQTPIWPIFGSESDTVKPASKVSLQEALDSHPSASIWRLPNAGERGEAFNLVYGKTSAPAPTLPKPPATVYIPTKLLSAELSYGQEGEMVSELQKALSSRGLKCAIDGGFGSETKEAVMMHQRLKNLEVDGVVGKFTWLSLGGKWEFAPVGGSSNRAKLAAFAKETALNHYELHSKDSFVWKEMVAPVVPAMQKLGHIGTGYSFVNWCSCFVLYCATRVGYVIPTHPEGYFASIAWVDAWVFWAKPKGFYFERRELNPQRGDIVIFDWDGDREANHIGIVESYTPGSSQFVAIEGNKDNVSGLFTRNLSSVKGWVRLP